MRRGAIAVLATAVVFYGALAWLYLAYGASSAGLGNPGYADYLRAQYEASMSRKPDPCKQ